MRPRSSATSARISGRVVPVTPSMPACAPSSVARALLADIAMLTGGTVVAEETGKMLDKTTIEDLGRVRRIEIDKDAITLIGSNGSPALIKARIAEVQQAIEDATSDYDREQLRERAARRVGGVALIKVGASTELEMKETKSCVEDALHATRAAVAEGIGAGGAVALLRARHGCGRVGSSAGYAEVP